jgi:SAM-dependent methyltransferase
MNNSPYYKDTGKIPFTSKISFLLRKRMFAKFMNSMKPAVDHKILDIGVTCDDQYQESNYFEKFYPYKDRIVCIGTEDGGYLESKYPGIKFIHITPHELLPFKDNQFDIVFSNAVLEHVGNKEDQKKFIVELLRVSRSFFLTTPNRWFPVEFHTAIPLLHYLPKKIYRKTLSAVGETYWSNEKNLNLLSRKELKNLFPNDVQVTIDGARFWGMTTNLIAYGVSKRK